MTGKNSTSQNVFWSIYNFHAYHSTYRSPQLDFDCLHSHIEMIISDL